mmetsp:Transcript_3100/g.6059  ORF Transcript_3100/g.6059 Transcript_3100/m.6059 type:complete len:228 (-) Transcript_3100:27-710(-)
MTSWARPPPRFPQPAAVAFMTPANSCSNIRDVQNWQPTNVAPTTPTSPRITARDAPSLIRVAKKRGIDAKMRRDDWTIRGPMTSIIGPIMKRANTVVKTDVMLATRISCWLRPRVFFITGASGAKENQAMNAMRKDVHARWKARMCGRAQQSLEQSSLYSSALCVQGSYFNVNSMNGLGGSFLRFSRSLRRAALMIDGVRRRSRRWLFYEQGGGCGRDARRAFGSWN